MTNQHDMVPCDYTLTRRETKRENERSRTEREIITVRCFTRKSEITTDHIMQRAQMVVLKNCFLKSGEVCLGYRIID